MLFQTNQAKPKKQTDARQKPNNKQPKWKQTSNQASTKPRQETKQPNLNQIRNQTTKIELDKKPNNQIETRQETKQPK